MSEFITNNFRGATITIGLTGLPILITGKVLSPQNKTAENQNNILLLKTEDDKLIYIAGNLIAFFF